MLRELGWRGINEVMAEADFRLTGSLLRERRVVGADFFLRARLA